MKKRPNQAQWLLNLHSRSAAPMKRRRLNGTADRASDRVVPVVVVARPVSPKEGSPTPDSRAPNSAYFLADRPTFWPELPFSCCRVGARLGQANCGPGSYCQATRQPKICWDRRVTTSLDPGRNPAAGIQDPGLAERPGSAPDPGWIPGLAGGLLAGVRRRRRAAGGAGPSQPGAEQPRLQQLHQSAAEHHPWVGAYWEAPAKNREMTRCVGGNRQHRSGSDERRELARARTGVRRDRRLCQ